MADTPYNARVDKIQTSSRTGSSAGDLIASESDRAEQDLQERGDIYRQQVRRQRLIAQRIRQFTEKDEIQGQIRKPRNSKFQNSGEDKKERITTPDAFFLGAVALFFDIIGGLISLIDFLIPPVGEIINAITTFPLATFTLYLLYKRRGIEFKDTKTLLRFWGSLVIGFIPYLAILPEYLLNVVLVTIATKAEDKIKALK
jgi:hypothetical protein